VPVPDISFCDATGALEEKVDANIYETSGRVKAVQDFQYDAFELFNHQLTTLLDDSKSTDMNIHDVEEEILTLKRFVSRVLSDSVNDEIPAISGTRHKRAASVNQTQQLLNSAKATFQQELAKITNKLAIISSSIAKEAVQTTAIHTKLLNELTSNQQTLTTTEQQLKVLDTTIRNVLKTTKPGTHVVCYHKNILILKQQFRK
jgi:septal ring factor EnvC (AmiA/AmiB activator)